MKLSDEYLGAHANSWLRFISVIIGSFLLYFALLFAIIGVYFYLHQNWHFMSLDSNLMSDGEKAQSLLFMLLSIALFHPVLALMMRLMYKRRYMSLFNPLGLPIKSQVLWGVAFVILFLFVSEVLSFLPIFSITEGASYEYVWQPRHWVIWFLPIALVTLLQSSAEEFFFRGFMQQYLARLVPIRWIYYVVPSGIWASMHYANIEGVHLSLAIVLSTFALGLVFADWADRSYSLAGPVAAHFVNNLILITMMGNTLEPSDLHIIRTNLDQIPDQILATYIAVFAFLEIAIYLLIRKRITVQI